MQYSIGRRCVTALAIPCVIVFAGAAHAQDRLKSMPGYDQYARMAPQIATAVPGRFRFGGVATWTPDSRAVDFSSGSQTVRYDLGLKKMVPIPDTPQQQTRTGRGRGGFGSLPERGRQFALAVAPAGNRSAIYRDRNVWLADSAGRNPVPITTDGNEKTRIKYGTASWVYGEELSQRTAMWWSPDGSKLAFYRFDESTVPDFYLATNLTHIQDTLDVEAYPKPGVPNPIVDVYVYDLATKKTTRLDVRDGKPFENATIGYYVYDVAWSPDGREVHFLRTNRRQNTLEMAACSPDAGACRTVLHEEWPTGWIDDDPAPGTTFLTDGNRFIWESDRSGFKNYYLYDFKAGKLLNPITRLSAEAAGIVRVDEPHNTLFYMARDGSNYMKLQLHKVKLDGTNDVRLTDPAFDHTISLAPDRSWTGSESRRAASPGRRTSGTRTSRLSSGRGH
jgi:dipeptidyl-peptidase-4